MDAADVASSSKSDTMGATIVSFVVSDPEVLIALSDYSEGPARTTFY